MRRQTKRRRADERGGAAAEAIVQIRVWLTGITPMVWRHVLVPASFTLRELHAAKVTMGETTAFAIVAPSDRADCR